MATPQRRTVFVATLVVTVGVMVVDRLFVLPKSAGAKDTLGPAANGLIVSVPDLQETPAGSVSLARRLESAIPDTQGAGDEGRDAFALSSAWHDGATGSQDPGSTRGERTGGFTQRHRLTAVALDGHALQAVIDDRAMVPGQVLDGCTLVEIHEDHVVFSSDEGQLVLTLESDP